MAVERFQFYSAATRALVKSPLSGLNISIMANTFATA
jgi:hypothetical protein